MSKIYLSTFKQSLKLLAKEIRETKRIIKEKQRNNEASWSEQCNLPRMKWEYRHKHIAYCLFRGKTLEQIEPKSYEAPEMEVIKFHLENLQWDPTTQKLYVIARQDLSKSQQAVQAGHALAEYLKKNPETRWENGTLVYLKAQKEELEKLLLDTQATPFYEEDLGNELTAIATLGAREATRHLPLI